METTIFFSSLKIGTGSVFVPQTSSFPKRRSFQRKHTVVSVLTPYTNKASSYSTTNTTTKTVYKDNWLEHVAIEYLSKAVQDTAGVRNDERGYESLVVAAGAVFRSFDLVKQRQLVVKALQSAVPGPVSFLVKTLMPSSKFSREYFAAFTTIFFPWLVGPCEVIESEFEGGKERNVVHIKKCRFLESSNCAGMCTNLCKIPSQEFIKNSFGIPTYMVPNFDDMSCKMVFGQEPPALQDDPALKQPCYKLCNVKNKHDTNCIS